MSPARFRYAMLLEFGAVVETIQSRSRRRLVAWQTSGRERIYRAIHMYIVVGSHKPNSHLILGMRINIRNTYATAII